MKLSPLLSRYVAVAAFALSTTPLVAHSQTSQTYRFGEGQSSLTPVPQSAPQPTQTQQAQPAPQAQQPHQTAKPAKRPPRQRLKKHRRHMTRRLPDQSLYSHP
ncbi:hypothetical protein [Paraburkholderia flava]|uniref:hypothetical protein n=1 Tax=Paraburkholderia flava TaxID=2547393 RepID=UPI00105E6757|nr:hypothetical protein [Paraburkholderia flava]